MSATKISKGGCRTFSSPQKHPSNPVQNFCRQDFQPRRDWCLPSWQNQLDLQSAYFQWQSSSVLEAKGSVVRYCGRRYNEKCYPVMKQRGGKIFAFSKKKKSTFET